ncbi:hypothetical protein COCOBI_16-1860 [Coccomyxa sp. Obi]|nr:hypothetical protein COCOBI_16-1860 [Coccomyxa sp. Obi]
MTLGPHHALPLELRSVNAKPLERYVRERITAFSGEKAFAQRLHLSPSVVQKAAVETLTELSVEGNWSPAAAQCGLVFRHDCMSLGCLDLDCELCKQTPHRRCTSTFAPKYLSGDALKAKCGARIRLEVIDRRTGDTVPAHVLRDTQIEICILDGRLFEEHNSDVEMSDEMLDSCVLLVSNAGKALLGPGPDEELSTEMKILAKLADGQAEVQCSIVGSSIALLTGQKPPFRLLARAIRASTGERLPHIKPAVSDAFVVATQRVKTAQKPDIPHIEEHVSKVECVGLQTQQKLLDISAAAAAVGIHNLSVVHNCVTTVGQFKELVESAEKDQPLQESLRKALNLTAKGWEGARKHALRAVTTDNRMRIWTADDSLSTGLLFRCNLGRILMDAPVGLLQKVGMEGPDQVRMEATLASLQDPFEGRFAAQLQQRAAESWQRPGHPGWCIWGMDSEGFVAELKLHRGRVHIVVPVPPTSHSRSSLLPHGLGDEPLVGVPLHVGARPTIGAEQPLPAMAQAAQAGQRDATDRSDSFAFATHAPAQQTPSLGRPPLARPPSSQPPTSDGFRAPEPRVEAQGAHIDSSQMLPSPFDNMQGGAASVASIPSSMQSAAPPSLGPGASLGSIPSMLPMMDTSEVDHLLGLQRRLYGESEASLPTLLSRLSGLFGAPPPMGPNPFFQVAGPPKLPQAPGENEQPPGGSAAAPSAQQQEASAGLEPSSSAMWRTFSDMMQYPAPWKDMPPETRSMMKRMSGRVSGLLDDLSDAMSLMSDILPSRASEMALGTAQDKRPGLLALPAAAAEPTDADQPPPAALPSSEAVALLANGTDSSNSNKRKAENSEPRSTRSKR